MDASDDELDRNVSDGIELSWEKIHDEAVERPRDAFVCCDIGR